MAFLIIRQVFDIFSSFIIFFSNRLLQIFTLHAYDALQELVTYLKSILFNAHGALHERIFRIIIFFSFFHNIILFSSTFHAYDALQELVVYFIIFFGIFFSLVIAILLRLKQQLGLRPFSLNRVEVRRS